MLFLRQSTASQEVMLGPFVDDTDGKTAETALTIANTDIKLWVEGGTTEASKTSGGATHIASGRYYCVLDATDTATLGKMEINVHVSGALPVRREFMVLSANVYDSLVLGSDLLDISVVQLLGTAWLTPGTAGTPDVNVKLLSGDATAADNAESFFDGTGYAGTNNVIPTVTAITGFTAADVGAIKAKTDLIPPDPADASDIASSFATVNSTLSTLNGLLDTEVAAILADTNELQTDWANGGRLDLILDARASQTSVDDLPTNAELAASQATADDATLAAIAALNNLSAAQVNAEVLDVLNVDTFAELTAPPAATSSLRAKLTWLFMWSRNKATATSTQRKLYADDGTTVVSTEALSDDATTYTKGEAS